MAKYQAAALAGNSPLYNGILNAAVAEDDTAVIGATLAIGDTIDLVKLAGGTRLQRLEKFNGDCDTGTTLQYKLGYRSAKPDGVLVANDAYFGTGLTDLQAAVTGGNPTRYNFAPITFNEDVIIFATVTAAATGMTGTPGITMMALGKSLGVK
jgi:hypothetical protein